MQQRGRWVLSFEGKSQRRLQECCVGEIGIHYLPDLSKYSSEF